jgi:CRP-like cAMP-binding protein
MDEPRYPVNAEAVVASVVIGFDRQGYLAILENSFPACRALLRQMVRRTRHHLDEIEALTIQNARYRLAHFLLQLPPTEDAERTITLPARKHLIAARLAMQPETLSRLFNELERAEIIRVHGSDIEVRNREALRGLLG